MATNRIEVELGISADVSAAKKAISNLEDSLSKLYKKQEQSGFQDLGLNEAVKTAKELEVCLSRALNQKTGKLDISAFQNGLKSAGLSMDQLNQKLLSAGSAGQQVFASLASSIAQAEVPLKRTNKLVSEFTRSIKNVFTYQISASMFQAVTSALSDAVSYTKDLNSSLNDIRIVTGQSSAQMAKFAVEANKSAQKLSTTTNNYAKASLIFYQQGLSDAEVKKRTDAVVKMANVTKESMDDVSSYMTAIWNNFDDGSESLEHYADVMTALGAATASSTKEIAAGLEKFASIGKTIGLSYEYATSAVATIVDKTRQSAETVGTGLRTIFSRLQGLSLGETLEDGVDLNKYSSALKTVGVNILDASGNMKEMDTILDSLAIKWGNLSTAQKTALAQTVGGVRQYTTLISLMDNWDSMKQNINTANTADGALQNQQDIYAESWEAASQRSKAALESLYQTLLNDKGFIALTDGLTTVTKAVTSLVSAMGGLPGILSTVGMIATKVFSKQITQGVRGATDKLTTWSSQFQGKGFWKSVGQITRGESRSAAQVKAGNAFDAQERSYSAVMGDLEKRGKKRSVEYMAAEQAQTLIGRKRRFMENEGRLTEEERIRAQDRITALSEAQERRLALRQEKDQQAREFSKLEDRAATNLLTANVSWTKTKGEKAGQNRSSDEQLQRLYYLSGLQGSTSPWQVSSKASADTRREKLQGMVTEARSNARKQTLAQDFLDSGMMADETQRSGTIAKINEAFGETVVGEGASLEEVQTKLQQIVADAAAARAEMDKLIKVSDTDNDEQKEAKKKVKELLDKASEQGQEQASRDKEAGHVAGTIKEYEEEIDGLVSGEKKLGDKLAAGIEKATATVGGLVTGFTQAKSAMEVLGDTGASVGEQISAGMSLASGAVTAFMTGGPWAAVAYLVGVVGSIAVDALVKQFNAAEIAAQKAEAVSENLNAAADEAANHFNALSSAISGYDSAIEVLNNCTKGTQEWNEALQNVHASISELLTDFPELMNQKDLFNSDGTLNKTILDQALEEAKLAAVAADAAALQGKVEAQQARIEADTVNTQRDFTGQYFVQTGTSDNGMPTGYWEDYNLAYSDGNKYTRTFSSDLNTILDSYSFMEDGEVLELIDVYEALGVEMGDNSTITKDYAKSLLELANRTIEATTMIDNAAKSVITSWSNNKGVNLVTGQAEFMAAAYTEAVETFSAAVKKADNDAHKPWHDVDHSVLGSEFDNTSFAGMSVSQAFNHARNTNYYLAQNGIRGDDNNRSYVFYENGKEAHYKLEEMQATIAAAAALEQMGAEAAKAKEKIANISGNLTGSGAVNEETAKTQAVGLQNYLASKNLESMTESDFKTMQDTVKSMGGASAYLQQAFGMTEEEITNAFGKDFITNFENTLTRTKTAWADAWGNNKDVAVEALGEVTKEMSLSNVAKLSNYMDEFSLGPAGAEAGAQFVEGLNKMIEDIDPEQQQAALTDLLTTVDWTSYDAFDQAQVILKKYGITINETDAYWKDFVADMRLASGAMPDFSKIKTDLNSISAIVKDLKFGDIVDEEDYQALIAYNDEWERFFLLQADGSRQFIGNAEDFNKFIQEKTIANREEIDLRRTVSELEGIGDIKWSEGGDAAKEAFEKYMQDDSFKALMEKMGYTSDMIGSMTAEQLKEMYTRIGEAVNANQIELDQSEFEQMIASMATSFAELDALYKDGTISADTYSRALLSMASGYEYCSTAAEDYVKAIGTDREDEARAALEAAVEAEEAASKLETAYSNAMSGKSSMTVEDLKALKESNEELYNSFLTMSDDDWYEAAYQAQVELLEQRMAGYAQESAEYKALMAEKQALDEEYYQNEKEKRQEAYNQFIDNWEERNNKTQTAIDALSIFEDGTAYGAQSFEAIEKLRQALLDTGKTAEEVDQILNNLGKDKDLDEVETVWAAAQEEARLLLERAGNNQQAQNDLGMDSNVQLVLTGVENQSSLIKELENGFQAKGVDTSVNANVVEGTFTSSTGILTYDKDGIYIITKDKDGKEIKVSIDDAKAKFKDGGVIVPIGDSWGVRWTTETDETFTAVVGVGPGQVTAGLAYDNGKWYIQFSENGETYRAEVGTSLGSYVEGLKCDNGKWYIVFSENGETYEAELSVSPGAEVRGLHYNNGKWYVQFSENGETYEAELGVIPGSVTSGLAYNNGKWYIQFSKNGETYTGTINASDLSNGKLSCTNGIWGVTWTADTGEEFTATFKTNPITDENWTKYLESTTNGIQLKMVNRTTGEVMTLSLNQDALAALATSTTAGSYLKWENGGFVLKTKSASLEITPVLNTDGTGFSLVNGQLTYQNSDGTTTVAGKDGSYFIVSPDGTATLIGADGTVLGSINANSGGLTQDTVAEGTQFVPIDESGALDLELAGTESQFGITYMTPGQMAEKYGFMEEASFYSLFDEHNPFKYMDENNLTLFDYMNHPFGGDPGSRNVLNNDLTYGALLSFASDHIQDKNGQYYSIARDIFRTQALAALTNRNGNFLGDPTTYASTGNEFLESIMADFGTLTETSETGPFGVFKGYGLYDPEGGKWDPSIFGLTNEDATDGIQVTDADWFNDMSEMILREFESDDGTLLPEVEAYFSGIIDSLKNPENLNEFTNYLSNIFMDPNVDTQTKMQGYFLAQGLLQACAETLGENDPIIQALNALIASMNTALGIASPSRITMQMGRYLAQGLQKGALEEDVDLSPLAEKALTSINKYLLNNGDKIPGVKKISQALHAMGANVFGKQLVPWGQAWREYRSTLQPGEVASNTGFRAWATDVKGYTYKDHNYYRPTTEQEYNDYLSTIGMSIQKIDGKYQIFGKDGKALVNKTFDNYNAALTEAIYGIYTEEAMIKYFSKNKDDNFLNYQDDASLTQIQKGLMDTLLDETLETAFEDTGTVYADWDALVNAVGFDKAMEYLNSAYSKHNVQFLNDTEMVWAQFNDIMVNAVSKQIEIEDKAAKEIVDIWKSAFQAILNARKTMLEGKSFIDDLSDDDLKSMIGQYAAAGMSPEDIRAMMFKTSGQILPAFNMAYNTPTSRSFLDSLLSYNEQGFVTSDPMKQTSSGTFIENDGFIAFKQGMEAALTSKIQTGMDEKLYGQLFTSDAFQSALATGNMETIIAAAQAINPALTKDEIELIALAAEKDEETGKYTFNKINVAAAVDRYITKMYPDLHQTYQDTVTGRVYTDLDYQKTVLNSARASGELYVNQQQEKFDIVSKAREAMLRGEDLRYALTEAEQKELLEITNQSDLTAVSLGDLDSASTTLTNTMIICAQQLGIAMGMIERGEATGFSIDPKTGKVTATKAVVNQNEVDKFLTSKQITRDKAGNYYRNGQIITADSNPDLWKEIQNVIQNNTTTTSVPLSGAASDNTGDVLDNAGAGNNDAVQLQYAQAAGFASLQEQDDYIKMMEKAGEDTANYSDGGMLTAEEIMNQSLGDEIDTKEKAVELQREYANQLALMEQGLSELNSSGKEWIKTLKSQNASMADQNKALTNLRKSYQKVLGLTDEQMGLLGDDFLKDEKNLDLVTKAATKAGKEGAEALDELQANAALAIIKMNGLKGAADTVEEVTALFGKAAEEISQFNFDAGEMVTGADAAYATIDGLYDKIVELGGGTEEAMATAAGAIEALGYTPSPITTETIEMTAEQVRQYVKVNNQEAYDAQGNPITVSNLDPFLSTNAESYQIQVPIGTAAPGIKTGKTGTVMGYRKNAEKTGGGGGGGGGGGSRRRYLAKAKPEDHKERYHEVNAAIDDVTDALERLNKQQDRAWGSARIKAMQEESKLLKEQTDLYRKKAKEAEDYLNGYYDSNGQWVKGDRQLAEEAGWVIDESGRVSNYEERLDDIINDYNSKIAEYNAMSAGEQEALEKLITEANERFEKGDKDAEQYLNPETGVAFGSYEEYLKYTFFDAPQQYLEQYEETMEEWEDIQKSILDNLYADYDAYLEQIKVTAEDMLQYIDDQIEYMEHKLSRLEDNAYKTAESIDLIVGQIAASESKLAVAEGELATLLGAHNINVEDFLAGKVSEEDLKNANFTATEIEMLRDIMSTAQSAEKEMSEGMVKGLETLTTAFDSFNEDLDRYTTSIEHAQSITSTYRNIIDLTGKSLSGFSTELLKAFNDATIEQAKANMSANKTKYDTVQVEYEKALGIWEMAQAQYIAGTLEDSAYITAKQKFEEIEDNLREAQESYMASWEAAIQSVADAYKSAMESVIEDVSKSLANGMTGGLDALQEYMDRAKTADSNYVDDYEKIYQLTKLTRDLNDKIDNTQNVKSQKELLKFQKEINDILQSDQKLSEYDIDYLQKKYDLKVAEIALEDAQNAKSQVMMRRDSEGNYNYVYTADEDVVAEAEAEYEGKLYEMQKANDEYITSLSDNILSLEQDMLNAINALDPAQFESKEDFDNRVADIIEFYTTQMEYQSSEMGKVLDNNKSLYENDMKWYEEYRDYKMADAATFLDSWDKILLSQQSGFTTQEAFFNNFKEQAGTLANESIGAYDKWAKQIAEINSAAGYPTETLGSKVTEDVQKLTEQAGEAAKTMETHADKIKASIGTITSTVTGMLTTFEGKVGNAADRVDTLTTAILNLFDVIGVDGFEGLNLSGVLAQLNIDIEEAENDTPFDSKTPGVGYDTGGYTGSWGSDGRLAWLHQKELVLNATDTANMLASVGILRQIASVIDLNALASAGGFGSLIASSIGNNRETLQQEVHIEAHFPNATDKNQIEDAFRDIVNLAAQYSNRSV